MIARNFSKFDSNVDGKLSKEEVKKGYLKHFGRLLSD